MNQDPKQQEVAAPENDNTGRRDDNNVDPIVEADENGVEVLEDDFEL